jgi:hypothetical protein
MRRTMLTLFAVALIATPALAETWYLMAPDPKVFKDPMVLHQMEQGMVTSTLQLHEVASYPSRAQCEVARRKYANDWREGRLVNMEWHQIGTTSPDWFVAFRSARETLAAQVSA